jgi:hypothetical protein
MTPLQIPKIPSRITVENPEYFEELGEKSGVQNLVEKEAGQHFISFEKWNELKEKIKPSHRFPSYLELFRAQSYDGKAESLSKKDFSRISTVLQKQEIAEEEFVKLFGEPEALIQVAGFKNLVSNLYELPEYENLYQLPENAHYVLRMSDGSYWVETRDEQGNVVFDPLEKNLGKAVEKRIAEALFDYFTTEFKGASFDQRLAMKSSGFQNSSFRSFNPSLGLRDLFFNTRLEDPLEDFLKYMKDPKRQKEWKEIEKSFVGHMREQLKRNPPKPLDQQQPTPAQKAPDLEENIEKTSTEETLEEEPSFTSTSIQQLQPFDGKFANLIYKPQSNKSYIAYHSDSPEAQYFLAQPQNGCVAAGVLNGAIFQGLTQQYPNLKNPEVLLNFYKKLEGMNSGHYGRVRVELLACDMKECIESKIPGLVGRFISNPREASQLIKTGKPVMIVTKDFGGHLMLIKEVEKEGYLAMDTVTGMMVPLKTDARREEELRQKITQFMNDPQLDPTLRSISFQLEGKDPMDKLRRLFEKLESGPIDAKDEELLLETFPILKEEIVPAFRELNQFYTFEIQDPRAFLEWVNQ